jgi:hypothetical protein
MPTFKTETPQSLDGTADPGKSVFPARADHKHPLDVDAIAAAVAARNPSTADNGNVVRPAELAAEIAARIAGDQALQNQNMGGVKAGTDIAAPRIGVWQADGKLGAVPGVEATETEVKVPSLLATDQAGTGVRAVFADATGQQLAEARVSITEASADVIDPALWIGAWDFEDGVGANIVTLGTAIGGTMDNHLPGYATYTAIPLTEAGAAAGSLGTEISSPLQRARTAVWTPFLTSLYTLAFFARSTNEAPGTMPLVELGNDTNLATDCDLASYQRLRISNSATIRVNGDLTTAAITYQTLMPWRHHAFVVDLSSGTASIKHYIDGVLTETISAPSNGADESLLGSLMTWNGPSCTDNFVLYNGEIPAEGIALLAAGQMPAADGTLATATTATLLIDDLPVQITEQAGTGTRLVASEADGTQAAQDALRVEDDHLRFLTGKTLRVDDHAGTDTRLLTADADGDHAPAEDIVVEAEVLRLKTGKTLQMDDWGNPGRPETLYSYLSVDWTGKAVVNLSAQYDAANGINYLYGKLSSDMTLMNWRGALADRPDPTLYPGAQVETTDPGARGVSRSDGTAWNPLPFQLPWETKTSSFVAVSGGGYIIDASSEPVTALLPANPTTGANVWLGIAEATNGVLVGRNGELLCGGAEDLDLESTGDGLLLVFYGTAKGWWPATALAPSGGASEPAEPSSSISPIVAAMIFG